METFAPALAVGFLIIVIWVASETIGQFVLLTAFKVKVTFVLIISALLGVYVVINEVLDPKVPVPEVVQ